MSQRMVRSVFHFALLLALLSGAISCSVLSSTEMKITPMNRNDSAQKEGKTALVFVHGVLGTGKDTWGSWPSWVVKGEENKYDVWVVDYPTGLAESPVIYRLGKELNKKLTDENILPKNIDTESKYDQVVFVAHSMGNLVVLSALLAGDSALELKVPLLLSIAAPWNGSALATDAQAFFANRQFKDMEKLTKNSFLQLLEDAWTRRKFPILITCAAEAMEYSPTIPFTDIPLSVFHTKVVNPDSAYARCAPQDRKLIEGEDHISIVKPKSESSEIHNWLKRKLEITEKEEMPWKLRRWQGKETFANNKRHLVCEIRIAGKEFHESNILMEMMALVLEDKIRISETKCARSAELRDLTHQIKITRMYDRGDAPAVLSELKNQTIDIYAEYSGALLYSHLNEIPVPPPATLQENGLHEPAKINELMSSANHPDFHKMKLLPTFGFDSGIQLVMLRSTAEQLQMIKGGKVTYEEIVNKSMQLAFIGDRDLLKRRDALGGLKAYFSEFNPGREVSSFHNDIYDELRKNGNCTNSPSGDYCQAPIKGAVAIGFKTDPLDEHEFVRIVARDGGYELPKHWASPMAHKFLDQAFPTLKPLTTLAGIPWKIYNEEMQCLIKEAEKITAPAKSENFQSAIKCIAGEYLREKGLIKTDGSECKQQLVERDARKCKRQL